MCSTDHLLFHKHTQYSCTLRIWYYSCAILQIEHSRHLLYGLCMSLTLGLAMPLCLRSFKNKPYHALSTCMHANYALLFLHACMPLPKILLCVSIQLVEFLQYWACRQSYFQFEMLHIICLSFVFILSYGKKPKMQKQWILLACILVNVPRQVCCGIYRMRDRLRGWSWVCNIPLCVKHNGVPHCSKSASCTVEFYRTQDGVLR